ncbi:neuroligin-4, X-linked isoform X2 [Orussus abietinus]|uniref:neuroligin-4, X-linked isoform X2 n=1 Tax=Orussus abietinus TaxID=222816 RepID=UPI000626DF0D|nr:neuroligin-4, X-linked isoform X2 [Orussus abietinus]
MSSSRQLAVWMWPLASRMVVSKFLVIPAKRIIVPILLAIVMTNSPCATRYASRIVETKSGQIRGILQDLNSHHLDPVEVFRGIPYAAPPTQNLRLKPPAAPKSWSGVKLADTFGAVCPQKYPDISNASSAMGQMPRGRYLQLLRLLTHLRNQSEDCLYLNLYIPGSGSRGLEAPYAVMVYIHGESFEWGCGNIYDGSVLASAGHVIVITVNYRLGILGTSISRTIVHNFTWVHQNIAAFGGDPSRITLLGHDTGAVLVNLLLLAPYGKDLFHRVVLLSGSALSPWASVLDPMSLRVIVAEQLGCSVNVNDDIADCLRQVPLQTIQAVELPEIRFMPRIGPSLPVDENNPDPGLDMERASDAFIKVPMILSVATAESYLDFNEDDIQYGFEEEQRNRILRTFIRNAYVYHLNEIFSAIRNEYTDWDKPVLHPINIRDATMEALSDGHTAAPITRIAFYHARRGAKTYFCHFSYQTKDSDYVQRLGSVRGEDIPYLFGLPLNAGGSFFPQNYSKHDQSVAEVVLTFFTNFAKTGNPNEPHNIESVDYGAVKEKTRFRGLIWEQYETGTQQYLMIAARPKMRSHYRGHKMAVWSNLIPQLHHPGDEDVSMKHHHFREREEHFYAGPVRDEWYTPVSLSRTSRTGEVTTIACTTPISQEVITENITARLNDMEDKVEQLHRLTSRPYYSTTTALTITVGVGCILLALNMIVFAGIYYQRYRDKKKTAAEQPRHQESLTSAKDSVKPAENPEEPPPSYTILATNPDVTKGQEPVQQHCSGNTGEAKTAHSISQLDSEQKDPKTSADTPNPLTATIGTIKKRVQIQEISV